MPSQDDRRGKPASETSRWTVRRGETLQDGRAETANMTQPPKADPKAKPEQKKSTP